MPDRTRNTQSNLDSNQYTALDIHHYELVYGQDFVSPGGINTARSLLKKMQLRAGQKVLDVGCGLGGAAFLMAREFDCTVDGIDLSRNMITEAARRCNQYGLDNVVSLDLMDCLTVDNPNFYDAVHSRDVFLHIDNKKELFFVLLKSLKPGGKLFFTDYSCGPKPWQPEFTRYVEDRGYDLLTASDYAQVIGEAGFINIDARDATQEFINELDLEIRTIETLDLPAPEKDNLMHSWQAKRERAMAGNHRWVWISAHKSTN